VLTGSLALVAALAGGCSSGSSSSTPPPGSTTPTTARSAPSSTTTASTGGLPPPGTYADGPRGTPHYTLDLTTSSAAAIAGSVEFVFQDGRTQTVFTFTGTPGTGQAVLTTSSGKTVSATYTTSSITLASCTAYLQYATDNGQCTFSRSATGA